MSQNIYSIAIVGAGPASLYGAAKLAKAGHHVTILNRDIKHGGLAEYGIYLNKYKMKSGLRKMFAKILDQPNISYYGNVTLGEGGELTLDELRDLGFDAIVVAVGAQGTKWLGLPNEQAEAVYHAKDLVYHYNRLPPFSQKPFTIGDRVAVVGFGNVALDIVHWLVCERQVEEVTLVARRGPNERACTPKELKLVGGALDLEHLRAEIDALTPDLKAVNQNPDTTYDELAAYAQEALEVPSPTRLRLRMLRSPAEIEVDAAGRVRALRCEITQLSPPREEGGSPGARSTGQHESIPCDTVVFAIGDSIEPSIGLPLEPRWRSTFATVPEPWEAHPDAPRYMVWNPDTQTPIWDTFVVGWARKASDGLVGKARADAEIGAEEILGYLNGQFPQHPTPTPQPVEAVLARLEALLTEREVPFVTYEGVKRIERREQAIATQEALPEFKFTSNAEMLDAATES